MTNEEMKVLKFKKILDNISKKLGGTMDCKDDNGKSIHPVKILLDVKEKNPFINSIVSREVRDWKSCGYCGANMEGIIEAGKVCSLCMYGMRCSVAGQTIFYALIALAIDNDLYNEKLEIVADAAYLMGFNAAMMEDWINGVKKILLAEEINHMEMKTDAGQKFFSYLS